MLKVKKHYKREIGHIDTGRTITSDPLRSSNNGVGLAVPSHQIKARSTQAAANGDWFTAKNLTDQWNKDHPNPNSSGGINTEGFKPALTVASQATSVLTKPFLSMNDTVNPTSLGIRDSISDAAISSGNPYAMAIGAATKIVDAIGDATGFHIDDIDKEAAKDAGLSGGLRFLNNAMNALPGNSLLMAAFSPGKTNEAAQLDDYGKDVMGGYSGAQGDIDSAEKLSGKRTLFGIGRRKINRFIDDTNEKVGLINQIGYTNALVKNSDYSRDIAQQNLNRYAGTNYNVTAIGKSGMKIMSRKELQAILAKKLQKGGVIGTDTNILPEGSLHARLNHLQDVNEDLEDVTRKGIPVLDANGNQVAEIERDELVLRLEVTKKIEELMKDGSEQAMIEAGKLLVDEIIDNTQDNTGQITEEVENGK